MAVPRKIRFEYGEVFPELAYAVSEIAPLRNFDKSSGEVVVQAVDEDTGHPVWTVEVLDGSAEARKSDRHLTVKIASPIQPMLPPLPAGYPDKVPFRPVEFTGLTGTPWVDDSGPRPRLAWSFRATGMVAPKYGSKPAAVPDEKAS
jgi:hypothetical protein